MPSKKLDGWTAQGQPDEDMCTFLRQMIVEAVFSIYYQYKLSSSLQEIYNLVLVKISKANQLGKWKWHTPSKRTIDRRVSDAADPKFYEDGVPKIVAVKAGVYTVNPAMLYSKEKTFMKDGKLTFKVPKELGKGLIDFEKLKE